MALIPAVDVQERDNMASIFRDDLECEICCDIYDDAKRRPKNLPCGHTFCEECMAKEITNGKRSCSNCRKFHNAKTVGNLPYNVVLERLIRNMPKTQDEAGEDDYSGGPCSNHKKSVVYFYCQTHSLNVCRECIVINHPVSKCTIISFKEEIEKKKDDNIFQADSAITAINDTLSALNEFVKEKDTIISNQEHEIQQWKKSIQDAKETIARDKIVIEKVRNEISQGKVKRKDLEAAKQNLHHAKRKKNIAKIGNNIETVSTTITKWIHSVSTEYDLLHKVLNTDRSISTETAVKGTTSNASTSRNEPLDARQSDGREVSTFGKNVQLGWIYNPTNMDCSPPMARRVYKFVEYKSYTYRIFNKSDMKQFSPDSVGSQSWFKDCQESLAPDIIRVQMKKMIEKRACENIDNSSDQKVATSLFYKCWMDILLFYDVSVPECCKSDLVLVLDSIFNENQIVLPTTISNGNRGINIYNNNKVMTTNNIVWGLKEACRQLKGKNMKAPLSVFVSNTGKVERESLP